MTLCALRPLAARLAFPATLPFAPIRTLLARRSFTSRCGFLKRCSRLSRDCPSASGLRRRAFGTATSTLVAPAFARAPLVVSRAMRDFGFLFFGFAGEPTENLLKDGGLCRLLPRGCWLLRRDSLHRSLRPAGLGLHAGERCRLLFGGLFHHTVGHGKDFHLIQLVVAQTRDTVIRGFQMDIGDQHHRYFQSLLKRMELSALLVEEEGGHVDGHLGMDSRRVFLHRLLLQDAQDVKRRGFDAANMADAVAARARDMTGLAQGSLQALARKFHQSEARDLAHLHPRPIVVEGVAKTILHVALVARILHIDEIDHHQPTQVPQAKLAGDFIARLEVGVERGLLDVGSARRPRGIDVDGDQGFSVIEDDGAARR
jgi:hypothetical protein